MRKLLSVILALVMVLGVFTPVFAEEAPKATEAPEAAPVAAPTMEKHVEFLKNQGIIQGDKNQDLMLDKNIDRASFAAILVRAAGKEATAQSVKTLAPRFKDLTVAHWANGYATVALESNLMKGNPAGEFMPGKEISYAEIATTLVRFLNKEKAGFVYPTSYIAAATELGLFNGVEIGGAFTSNATRNNVFKMLYNAVSKEDFGRFNVYKVIVLENNRVAKLAKDEVKAEVLSVVQVANNVSDRNRVAKVGQQFVLNVKDVKAEGVLADTENLLGKVVDVTLDETGKLVKVAVDNSYKYLAGGITVLNEKYFAIGNQKYSVRVDERYYGDYRRLDRDDRMYRTYLTTDKGTTNYTYLEFAKMKEDKKIAPNFARMTVKDGMVLFVDAFNLQDIAPVEKVARDGQDIYYYNDVRNATVERQVIESWERVLGYTAKDGFFNYDRKDIKADDVIHWMKGLYIVRTDAKMDTKLVDTYLASNGQEYATLKGAEDKNIDRNLGSKQPQSFKSVYAYDDQHFRTLTTREYLKDMRGSDVKVLFDVRNFIQLITSHEKFSDKLGLINKAVSSKGMEFYATNAPEESRFRLTDGWDSNYYKNGWNNVNNKVTQANKLDAFSRLDLAYTSADKDGNAKIVAAIDNFFYDGEDYYGMNGNTKVPNKFAYAEFTNERRNEIIVGGQRFRYTDDTEVLVINRDNKGRRIDVIEKVTLADVIKNNKNNRDLEAVVLTEKAYGAFLDKIKVSTYGRYDATRGNLAKAIVFSGYNGPQTEVGKVEYGRVETIYNWTNKVEIEVAQGVYETFEIDPRSAISFMNDVKNNDYVQFRRVKDADPAKAVFDKVIAFNAQGLVEDYRNFTLKLKGENDIYTWKETNVFGNMRDGYADVYVVDGYAELIVFSTPEAGASKGTRNDQLDAKAFEELVNKAVATPTAENIRDAYVAYDKLSDAAKKLAKKNKKILDDLYDAKILDTDYKPEYDAIVAELKKFDNAGTSRVTEANYKAAKELLAKAKALHGKKYGNATVVADDIEAKVKGYVKTVEENIVKDQIDALKKDVKDAIAKASARIKNSNDSLNATATEKALNNHDLVKAMNAKKAEIDALTTSIVEGAKDDKALEAAKEAKVADLKMLNEKIREYNIAEDAVRSLLNR